MEYNDDALSSESTKPNDVIPGLDSNASGNTVEYSSNETHTTTKNEHHSDSGSNKNDHTSALNTDFKLNPHEQWQKDFNERIEVLKNKEADEIEKRTKDAAIELEEWHKNHRKQIDEKLQKLLEEEPSDSSNGATDFDWVTAANYLETSEYFGKDQAGGINQKLIELILKKKAVVEASRVRSN